MKMLFAADGSSFTKKALAFLVANNFLTDSSVEVHVFHVHALLPPRIKNFVGKEAVDSYYLDESEKVLTPIRKFLTRHGTNFKTDWTLGNAGHEIVERASRINAHMIVMGTHGYGKIGQMILGSVAQKVVSECDRPVLLVK
jgi:nucleotide-binding universal stress UspA family protein